ncbi:hypothetical protein ACFL35_13515 [Candidatus Riflebacteria bacterium]
MLKNWNGWEVLKINNIVISEMNKKFLRFFFFYSLLAIVHRPAFCAKKLWSPPKGFKKVYKQRGIKTLTSGTAKRKLVIIQVPKELNRKDFEDNLKLACVQTYKEFLPIIVRAVAYRMGDPLTSQHIARCDFAPFGDWKHTSSNVNLADYDWKIWINEIYFKKKTLVPKLKGLVFFKNTANLFRGVNMWDQKSIIVPVKKNSIAEILAGEVVTIKGNEHLRYQVKILHGSAQDKLGWVFGKVLEKLPEGTPAILEDPVLNEVIITPELHNFTSIEEFMPLPNGTECKILDYKIASVGELKFPRYKVQVNYRDKVIEAWTHADWVLPRME